MQDRKGTPTVPPAGPDPNPGPAAARLCTLIRAGDRAAFTTLYNAWYDRWMRQAAAILRRDHPLKDDIVQDAFLRVIRSLPVLTTDDALAAWMTACLRSAALDALRREQRRLARDTRAALRTAPIATNVSQATDLAWMSAALDGMLQEDAALLRARIVQGASLDQAGRAVGVSGDAAHGRIRRALARLRAAIGGAHE